MVSEVVFAVSTCIVAAILIAIDLRFHRMWTSSRRYAVAILAGVAVALVLTAAIGLSWRAKEARSLAEETIVAASASPSPSDNSAVSAARGEQILNLVGGRRVIAGAK